MDDKIKRLQMHLKDGEADLETLDRLFEELTRELGDDHWDDGCDTCIHEAECSEIGGRQEGRGFGAGCDPSMGEVPHYERKGE